MSFPYNIINPRRRSKPIPAKSDSSGIPASSFSGEYSVTTTSTDALEATETTTNDTLDMISSPWSSDVTETADTDSWTDSPSEEFLTYENQSSGFTSVSIEPKTSTTNGIPTPFTSDSRLTLTLMSTYMSDSNPVSSVISPLVKDTEVSHQTSVWTMETFTSTGRTDSNRLTVNYPWSPKTYSYTDFTDYYPGSSGSLSSQKVSRESFSAIIEPDQMKPMNYIAISLDENVLFDWILVKQRGLEGPKLLVTAKV